MSIRTIWVILAFLLAGSISPILSQNGPASDSAVYFSFFREAAGRVPLPVKPPPGAPPKGEWSHAER